MRLALDPAVKFNREYNMKGLGLFLIALGLFGLLAGLMIDTTVDAPGLSQRVHNIGLMDQRRNLLIAAGFVFLGGLVCCGFAECAGRAKAAKTIATDDEEAERFEPKKTALPREESGELSQTSIGKILLVGSVGLIAFLLAIWAFTHI